MRRKRYPISIRYAIPENIFYMHPPEASNYYNAMHAYIHSLARLEGYRGAFDWVYPSHGSLPWKSSGKPYPGSGAARGGGEGSQRRSEGNGNGDAWAEDYAV